MKLPPDYQDFDELYLINQGTCLRLFLVFFGLFIFNIHVVLFLDYLGAIPLRISNSRYYKTQANKELLLGDISPVVNILKVTFQFKI